MVRPAPQARRRLIKVMSTGGFMTEGSAPWFAQFSRPRCGPRSRRRTGSASGSPRTPTGWSASSARRAGVDTLEHCTFVQADGSRRVAPELADRIAASAAYVSPTWNLLLPLFQSVAARAGVRAGAALPPVPASSRAPTPASTTCRTTDSSARCWRWRRPELPNAEVLTAAASRAAEALGLATVTGRAHRGPVRRPDRGRRRPAARPGRAARPAARAGPGRAVHPGPAAADPAAAPGGPARLRLHHPGRRRTPAAARPPGGRRR